MAEGEHLNKAVFQRLSVDKNGFWGFNVLLCLNR